MFFKAGPLGPVSSLFETPTPQREFYSCNMKITRLLMQHSHGSIALKPFRHPEV